MKTKNKKRFLKRQVEKLLSTPYIGIYEEDREIPNTLPCGKHLRSGFINKNWPLHRCEVLRTSDDLSYLRKKLVLFEYESDIDTCESGIEKEKRRRRNRKTISSSDSENDHEIEAMQSPKRPKRRLPLQENFDQTLNSTPKSPTFDMEAQAISKEIFRMDHSLQEISSPALRSNVESSDNGKDKKLVETLLLQIEEMKINMKFILEELKSLKQIIKPTETKCAIFPLQSKTDFSKLEGMNQMEKNSIASWLAQTPTSETKELVKSSLNQMISSEAIQFVNWSGKTSSNASSTNCNEKFPIKNSPIYSIIMLTLQKRKIISSTKDVALAVKEWVRQSYDRLYKRQKKIITVNEAAAGSSEGE